MSSSEDKANSKPFDSEYYGWSHRINESRKELEKLGVDITPSKIEGKSPCEEKTESTGVSISAWNSAGTWEERNFSKWASQRIPEILKTFNIEKNGYKITLPSVDKCDGQATIVFSKGKKRPGFDMNLKISWSAACDTEEEDASGFVIVNEFSDISDGDYEWSFKANKSDENHIKAKAAVQSCKKDILKLLEQWIDEFKHI